MVKQEKQWYIGFNAIPVIGDNLHSIAVGSAVEVLKYRQELHPKLVNIPQGWNWD